MSYHPIELDKMRNFRYGMRAISLVEKKLRKPFSKINIDDMTMEETSILLWAGLQHEDKDLTPDKVMDLVDGHSNMVTVFKAMGEAVRGAFGNTDELIEDETGEEGKNE